MPGVKKRYKNDTFYLIDGAKLNRLRALCDSLNNGTLSKLPGDEWLLRQRAVSLEIRCAVQGLCEIITADLKEEQLVKLYVCESEECGGIAEELSLVRTDSHVIDTSKFVCSDCYSKADDCYK